MYGPWFQAECRSTLGEELKPADGQSVRRIMDGLRAEGVEPGGWAIPRFLSFGEGQIQGWAASVCELFVLDVEPYADFLDDPYQSPADYIAGLFLACDRPPWISVVPQPTGIDALRGHLAMWIGWSAGLRPQCYFTDSLALDYPEPSMTYLYSVMADAGVYLPIVPIFPRRELSPRVDELLASATGDADLWVLG